VHRSDNRLYHLAAGCPAGCAGHPNWEADYADAHDDGQEVRLLLDLRIR